MNVTTLTESSVSQVDGGSPWLTGNLFVVPNNDRQLGVGGRVIVLLGWIQPSYDCQLEKMDMQVIAKMTFLSHLAIKLMKKQ
ncbi:MAG: hypothetical protein Pars92KO_25830 [Parasphingorhabdus sp.]